MTTAIALRRLNAGTPTETLIAYITDQAGNEIKLATLMGNDINPQTACEEAARELKNLAHGFELLHLMPDPENTMFQLRINTLESQKLPELVEHFQTIGKKGE
jgi:hypothetical protein